MEEKTKKAIGMQGEKIAKNYLMKRGYRVITENYRAKNYEVDLILQKNDTMVFVEVKVRSHKGYGTPESFVDSQKEHRIVEAAENYLWETAWEGKVRFDIIGIEMAEDIRIRHFQDAFS